MEYEDGGKFHVPKIPIVIEGNKQQLVMGLLDSGATNSFIPRSLANYIELEINESEEHNITTVGQKVPGHTSEMRIIVEGPRQKRYTAKIPVIVLEEEDLDEIIIGRTGFFNLFRITFHENEKIVVLKPYPEGNLEIGRSRGFS